MAKVIFFCLLVAVDQFSKHLALTRLQVGESREVIEGFFSLTLVFNPGAAFGMFSAMPDGPRRLTLGIVSALALLVVLRLALREVRQDRFALWALTGIFGGAVGNLIDRFRFDAVVDFLDFYYGTLRWPAFNVADSAICIGVFVVVLRMFLASKHVEESAQDTAVGNGAAS